MQSGLSINQRNIYAFFLAHRKRYGNRPCMIPRSPLQASRLPDYIKAIENLEKRGLVRVARPTDNYLSWTLLPGEAQAEGTENFEP